MNYAHVVVSNGFFVIKAKTNIGISVLVYFLTDDVYNTSGWIEWVCSGDSSTESNATWLEKNEDRVVMGDLTDILAHLPEEKCLTINVSQKNLIDILKKWDRVLKEKPSEFWLTEKDGVYDLHFEKPEWVDE